jgi:hypothetical protein
VFGPPAIQMHRPGEPLGRLEEVHLLFEQQSIRAHDDEFFAGDGALYNLLDFLVQ